MQGGDCVKAWLERLNRAKELSQKLQGETSTGLGIWPWRIFPSFQAFTNDRVTTFTTKDCRLKHCLAIRIETKTPSRSGWSSIRLTLVRRST